MKKILLSLLIVTFLGMGSAYSLDNWKDTNQVTIAWDQVTTLSDNSMLPAGHSLKYKIYLANAVTDPDKTNPAELGETDQLNYTITLNVEGKYLVGVSTTRYDETGAFLNESEINWSDVNGESTPDPFGLRHWFRAAVPKNLR